MLFVLQTLLSALRSLLYAHILEFPLHTGHSCLPASRQKPVNAFWSCITSEIALIRGGEGGDLLSGVEAWVRAMQFCALQDMAKEYPDHFDDC
jgi:hypothetical protein